MFNKNTRITYELLPDGVVYIQACIGSDVDAAGQFFANLFDKTYLKGTLDSIKDYGVKKNRSDSAKEIIGFVIESQQEYEPRSNRPIIECDQVFVALQQRINNEGE